LDWKEPGEEGHSFQGNQNFVGHKGRFGQTIILFRQQFGDTILPQNITLNWIRIFLKPLNFLIPRPRQPTFPLDYLGKTLGYFPGI